MPTVARCTQLKGTNIYEAFRRTIKSTIRYYGCESEESKNELLIMNNSEVSYPSRKNSTRNIFK